MECPYCQHQVEEEDNFCRHCGHKLKTGKNIPGDIKKRTQPGSSSRPLPKINQNIKIEVEEKARTVSYDSRVVDWENSSLVLLHPFARKEPAQFEIGQEITIFFAEGSAAYRFSTRVEKIMKEPFPALIVEKPQAGAVEKIQRRDYFRLEVERRVWYRPVNHLDEPLTEDFTRTKSLEIGGGGMKLIMLDIDESDINQLRLEVKLDIPPLEDKSIISRLVNIYEEIPGEKGAAAGIKFIDIHYEDRDKLMGWLFEKQRQLREKGLI